MKSYGSVHIMRQLYAGQSLVRILMNQALAEETICGRVVDIGGGRLPDYFDYLHAEKGATVEAVDGSLSPIDFEKDSLPYVSASVDTILMCNILEHVYHHAHLLSEARRILRPGGRLIGFVPFWVGYHPDPHDYFRYTHEALHMILSEAGFQNIHITRIGRGPLAANFNTIVLSLPRFLRPLAYIPYATFDLLFLFLRPASKTRFPLGYMFTAGSARDTQDTL